MIGLGYRPTGAALPAQTFTASGTYVVPTGVTLVEIDAIGGGGGGGGAGSQAAAAAQSGGGGGALGRQLRCYRTCVAGETITVTVGNGGPGGNGGAAGGNTGIVGTPGQDTTITIPSSGTVIATGGTAGKPSPASSGGIFSGNPYGVPAATSFAVNSFTTPGASTGVTGIGPSMGSPLTAIGSAGGAGASSTAANGGNGGGACNGFGATAAQGVGTTATTAGANGADAPANTGGGGGGGGGGTNATGAGGNGGAGGSGYCTIRPAG